MRNVQICPATCTMENACVQPALKSDFPAHHNRKCIVGISRTTGPDIGLLQSDAFIYIDSNVVRKAFKIVDLFDL